MVPWALWKSPKNHHGVLVCLFRLTCTFTCIYLETCKHSSDQATSSKIPFRLFPSSQPATANFLFSLSMPRLSRSTSAVWASLWSPEMMGVEQCLNHFMSDIQDKTTEATALWRHIVTQANVNSYCFCYWNQRCKWYTSVIKALACWHSHLVQRTWLLVEVFGGIGKGKMHTSMYMYL